MIQQIVELLQFHVATYFNNEIPGQPQVSPRWLVDTDWPGLVAADDEHNQSSLTAHRHRRRKGQADR